MACASSPPSKLEKKLSEQLNCAICLETYKSPRSLACLHTFCEGCIRSHILQHVSKKQAKKTATIKCPLCRADTASPCPSKPRSEWVRELPVNFALVSLLETMEIESKIECDNCRGFNKKSMATVYCKDCEQYQCDNCSSFHQTSTVMMKHKLIAVPEMTSDALPTIHLGSLQYCYKHKDFVEFYCEDDNALCCINCAFSKHRQCKTVTELTALGQGLKDGDRSKTLDTEMGQLQTTLTDLTDELRSDVAKVQKHTQDIPQKMILARNRIVKTLDQLVAKVTAECGQMKKQHSTELDDKMTTVKSLQAAIMTTRSTLESLRKTGTVTQVFIVIHKLEEQASQYQIQVKDVQNSMTKVDVDIHFSEELNRLIENVDRLNATVVDQPLVQLSMAKCAVKTLPPVDIVKRGQLQQPGFNGSVILPDGRHAVIDFKNSLCCLLDEFYTVTAEIKLRAQPFGIAVIGPRELVVALPIAKQLQIIRVQGKTLTLARTVKCPRSPWKLSRVSDTELAVAWDKGLGIINLNGQERSYLSKDKTGRAIPFNTENFIEVDAESNRLFHACWDRNTVYCLSYTGDVHFSYSNNLVHPSGMAIDRDGNLCICSHGTHTIHQISPTGQHIRRIDPGINFPGTVCFNPVGDTMTVLNCQETTTQGSKVKFGSEN